jgi:ATP-binding cassette, subfamily C, bacterial LapB
LNIQAITTVAPEPVAHNEASGRPIIKDPLADALLFLAAHHGRAISREALLSNLPILDGRLTPALFGRAARRAGMEAEAIK